MAITLRRICVPMYLFVIAVGLTPRLAAQDRNPVSIEATITRHKDKADRFTITVEFSIQEGWHTYDEVPKGNPSPTTMVTLDLPRGVKAIGDWKRPVGRLYAKDSKLTVFDGTIKFTREVEVSKNSDQREMGIAVSYQVCKGQLCLPPSTHQAKISLADAAKEKITLTIVESNGVPSFTNKYFQAPIRLFVGSEPLNKAAKQMYPSPAMFDVDNDGDVELIVGDIFGSINVYENKNSTGKGDPIWSSHTPLKTAKGENIKVSNW